MQQILFLSKRISNMRTAQVIRHVLVIFKASKGLPGLLLVTHDTIPPVLPSVNVLTSEPPGLPARLTATELMRHFISLLSLCFFYSSSVIFFTQTVALEPSSRGVTLKMAR